MDRHAERLQHHAVQRVERLGQRDELRFRRPDALGHRPVKRRRADELDVGAEICMALTAPLAMSAGLVRIDCDELTAPQAELLDVVAEIAAELVAGHERRLDDGRADAAVLVVVQIAAADADRGDVDQDLAFAPLPQIKWRHANIARSTNEKGPAHQPRRLPWTVFPTPRIPASPFLYVCVSKNATSCRESAGAKKATSLASTDEPQPDQIAEIGPAGSRCPALSTGCQYVSVDRKPHLRKGRLWRNPPVHGTSLERQQWVDSGHSDGAKTRA